MNPARYVIVDLETGMIAPYIATSEPIPMVYPDSYMRGRITGAVACACIKGLQSTKVENVDLPPCPKCGDPMKEMGTWGDIYDFRCLPCHEQITKLK